MNKTKTELQREKDVENFDANSFFEGIRTLYPLYESVTKAIKLGELFDIDHNINLAPINQLRNVVGHIFMAAYKSYQSEILSNELKEVKEHLERAGYDALEILAILLDTRINNMLSNYTQDTIATIFPRYYSEYRPKLSDIRVVYKPAN